MIRQAIEMSRMEDEERKKNETAAVKEEI